MAVILASVAASAIPWAVAFPAEPTLERLFPPAVAVGQSAEIRAEGKWEEWPLRVWCDRPDVEVTPGDEPGVLRVVVPAGNPPGIAWLRLLDDQGVSALAPLLVETDPVVVESEPNDGVTEATPVAMPMVAVGRLEKRGDVDGFRVAVREGETLVASLTAHELLGSPMDGVMQLADLRGNVLAQSDDVRGLDPQLVYRATEDSEWVIRIFAFPETATSAISFAGEASFVYALRATTGPFLDHVDPIAVGGRRGDESVVPVTLPTGIGDLDLDGPLPIRDTGGLAPRIATLETASGWYWQPLLDPQAVTISMADTSAGDALSRDVLLSELPAIVSGRMSEPDQIDRLRVPVEAGRRYRVRTYAKSLGFLMDPLVRVMDREGKVIAEHDDRSRNDFEAELTFSPKSDGQVQLLIADAVDGHGPRHAYAVWVGDASPEVSLDVDADRFRVTAGETLEIPVRIARTGGFEKSLTVTAEGLPAGVRVVPADSAPQGDTAKSVSIKLVADADNGPLQSQFRIVARVGRPEADSGQPPHDGPPHDGPDRYAGFQLRQGIRVESLWLTRVPASP